ncbi:hypothetical protein D3C76_1737250 [compost metagenome]
MIDLDGALQHRVLDQAARRGLGVDAVGLSGKLQLANLTCLDPLRHLIDIMLAQTGNFHLVDIADLEIAVQSSGSLVVTV